MFKAKKYITVSIGQCGLQVSNAVWELFCLEHGIFPSGDLDPAVQDIRSSETFFSENYKGLRFARTVSCDLECTVIDEIRTGSYRNLFPSESLINGLDDGASVYARGYYTTGKPISKMVLDKVDRMAADCPNFGGFVLINGYGGGTGSGLGDLICTGLRQNYPKATIMQLSVLPSFSMSNTILEPYNSLFATKGSLEQADVSVQLNNEPCFGICEDKLEITQPSFTHINRLMCQVFSSITASARFNNELYCDLTQIQVNTVPYPKVHFPTAAFSPFENQEKLDYGDINVGYITREVFEKENNLAGCDLNEEGKYLAIALQFRGSVSPYEMAKNVMSIKRGSRNKFVKWSPTGFKMGVCSQPTMAAPQSMMGQSDISCTGLFNHTGNTEPFKRILKNFKCMYHSRSFVHWYVGEGMEEGEFEEAHEALVALLKAYTDCLKGGDSDEEEAADAGGEE